MSVHRGRTKVGKTQLCIWLAAEELAGLTALAEANIRSRSGQVIWLIKRALKEVSDAEAD
jgi:hypothetical protein